MFGASPTHKGSKKAGKIDLGALGANTATDIFILKFLLCNERNQDGTLPKNEESETEEEEV